MVMKIFFVSFLLYNRGLTIPITTLNPNEEITDRNVSQSSAKVSSVPSSLTSSNDSIEGNSAYTTPTMFETIAQELEAELEMTTASNPTETTMPFTNPSPNQEEVLSELQDLWYYSEGLSDSQNGLKSSISSIVHLAYIRVQTEPEETLDRLKYMLQKLKARLFIGEEYSISDSPTTTAHQDFDNQNTEIIFADDSTTQESSPTTDESAKEAMKKIQKRSIGIGEYEHVFLHDNSAENSLFPIVQANNDRNNNQDKSNSNIVSTTPTEATIQKIIHVKDRAPIPHKMNSTINLPQIQVHSLDFTNSSSHGTTESIYSTTEISAFKPSIMETMMNLDKKPIENTINSQDDENENSITADQIASAIFLLLNTGVKDAPSSTQNFTVKIPLYFNETDIPPVNNNAINIQVQRGDNKDNQTELDQITTTLRPLPHYLNKFQFGLMPQEPPKLINKKTTIVINKKRPIENSSISTEINTAIDEIPDTTVSTRPQSPIVHIMTEFSESNILMSPTTILNGTKEGIVQFVQTFNTLSFTAKMTLLFVLSVSILSIALGIYSMGPPIIAVGVLGIVIPIALLILLQTNLGKKRNKGKKEGMHLETAINEFANEEFNQVIDLIFDAINKYAS